MLRAWNTLNFEEISTRPRSKNLFFFFQINFPLKGILAPPFTCIAMDDLLTRDMASLALSSEVTLDDSCYNLLRRCLNNQSILSKFRNFLELNFCEENLCFYLEVQELSKPENNDDPNKLKAHTIALFEKYFKEGGPNEVSIFSSSFISILSILHCIIRRSTMFRTFCLIYLNFFFEIQSRWRWHLFANGKQLNIPCEMKEKVRDHINELSYKQLITNDILEIFEETLCQVVEMLKFDCLPKFLKAEPEVARMLLTSSESQVSLKSTISFEFTGNFSNMTQASMSDFSPPILVNSGASSKPGTLTKNSSLLKKLHLRRRQSSSDLEGEIMPALSNAGTNNWSSKFNYVLAHKAAILKKKEKLEHFFGAQIQNSKLSNQTQIPEVEYSPISCSPPTSRLPLRRSNSSTNVKLRRSKTVRKLEKFFGESVTNHESKNKK